MPSRAEIVSFDDSPPPPGADPWVVAGTGPGIGIEVSDPDPGWPRQYDRLAGRIRRALGWRALQLDHVGSTSVPGLAAKPIIDIDLTVADPACERDYVPARNLEEFRSPNTGVRSSGGNRLCKRSRSTSRAGSPPHET